MMAVGDDEDVLRPGPTLAAAAALPERTPTPETPTAATAPAETDEPPREAQARRPATLPVSAAGGYVTPLSRTTEELKLNRVPVDIRALLSDGLDTRQMIEGIVAQEDVDPRWRKYIDSARKNGFDDDTLLAELTGASPDVMAGVLAYGGRGAGRGATASAGAITGAKVGAKVGTAVLPGKGTLLGGALGAIGGGVMGYLGGDWAVSSLFGDPEQFTPKVLPYAVAAETAAEIGTSALAFSRLPLAARAVEKSYMQAAKAQAARTGAVFDEKAIELGKFAQILKQTGESMVGGPAAVARAAEAGVAPKLTGAAKAVWGAEAALAGVGAGAAQTVAPENPWARFGAEMAAGTSLVGLSAVAGSVAAPLRAAFSRVSETAIQEGAKERLVRSLLAAGDSERFSPEAMAALTPEEQAARMMEGAEDLMERIKASRAELEVMGFENPKARLHVPELNAIANAVKRADPQFAGRINAQDEEGLAAAQTFLRQLFDVSDDPDLLNEAALMRDQLNERQIEDLLNVRMAEVARVARRGGEMEPADLTRRVDTLLKNRAQAALKLTGEQGEFLYNQVNKGQTLFAPRVVRQYQQTMEEGSLLPVEGLDRAVTDTTARARNALQQVFAEDFATLERWMDSPDSTTVGELLAFRRRMNAKARTAGDRDRNLARIYRSFERAAADDLQDQYRITGWRDEFAEPLEDAAGLGELPIDVGDLAAFSRRAPVIEQVQDPALEAANSFWRARNDVFRRQFMPRALLRRDAEGAYKMQADQVVDAFVSPSNPARAERNLEEMRGVANYLEGEMGRLEAAGVPLAPGVDLRGAAAVLRQDVDEAVGMSAQYIMRSAVDPVTGSVDAKKLASFRRDHPQFMAALPVEVRELFESAPKAQLEIARLSKVDTPMARAQELSDEFAPILTAMLGRRRIGGQTVAGDVEPRLPVTALIGDLLKSPNGSRDFSDLAAFAARGPQSSRAVAQRLGDAGIDVRGLDADRVRESFVQAYGDYVFEGSDFNAIFQRITEPAQGGGQSTLRIMQNKGLLTTEQARTIRNTAEMGRRWQDLLESGKLAKYGDNFEQAIADGILPETFLRTIGSSIGGWVARKLGDSQSLIIRSAFSKALLNSFNKVFNSTPLNQMNAVFKDLLLTADADDLTKILTEQFRSSEQANDVAQRLQGHLARYVFGPRPTTAELRLLTAPDYSIEEQAEPEVERPAPRPQPRPAPAPRPQQPPQAAAPVPPPRPQSSLSFDDYLTLRGGGGGQQQQGGAPGGPAGPGAAEALFPFDPMLAQAGQPQGFAAGGLASLRRQR
jgi:hypothetical protein